MNIAPVPELDIKPFLNPNHKALFAYSGPELIVYGGANAGKSYSIADKLLLQSVLQPDEKLRCLVIRKTFPSLRHTALQILEERAELFGLPWKLTEGKWIATCGNMTFIFLSLHTKDDYNKLKSMTNIDFIWINELTEITEDGYEECLRRLRGGQSAFEQIMGDFNPVGKHSWCFNRFFKKNIGRVKKLKYTMDDNHPDYLATPKAQRELARLDATKKHNKNLWTIYRLGEWGELKGIIFNWDVVPMPEGEFWDEIFYGGDFGFSIDPAVLLRIYRKANHFWLVVLIYETGLTNPKLAKKMDGMNISGDHVSYWDCAEPKSIQELVDEGIAAKPCEKGPDSIKAGIDFLLDQHIHIIEESDEHPLQHKIIDEQKSYVRAEDKDGNFLPIPVKFNDHAMSAGRYGIHTHCKNQPEFYLGVGTDSWAGAN